MKMWITELYASSVTVSPCVYIRSKLATTSLLACRKGGGIHLFSGKYSNKLFFILEEYAFTYSSYACNLNEVVRVR